MQNDLNAINAIVIVSLSSCQEEISGTSSKILKSSPQNQQIEMSSAEFEEKGEGILKLFVDF